MGEQENKQRRKLFEGRMQLLGAAYGRNFDVLGMRAYYLVLGNLTDAQLTTAFKRAMDTERFCPSPATVKAYAPPAPASKDEGKAEESKTITPWTRKQADEAKEMFKRLVAAVTPEESKGKSR